MDGIDVALLDTDGQCQLQSKGGSFLPYPRIFQTLLKAAEFSAKQALGDRDKARHFFPSCWQSYANSLRIEGDAFIALEAQALAYLNTQLGLALVQTSLDAIIACSTELHRLACLQLLHQLCLPASAIDVIGYHGQTLYHNPAAGFSWQAGDPQTLANAFDCRVIANFRQADIESGGHGAPLTPIYHHALINAEGLYPAVVINCGGIANITIVTGTDTSTLMAFDAGPGNVLLDRFIKQATLGAKSFDQDGELALQGTVSPLMLTALKAQALPADFMANIPPKSLDSHDCYLPEAFHQLSLADGLATLAAFTAECLVTSLCQALPRNTPIKHVILAGGGWYHPVILQEFKQRLSLSLSDAIQISTAKQLGWQQDLLEAEAFAYLAKRSLLALPLSMPLTTGVTQAQTGGDCFMPVSSPL